MKTLATTKEDMKAQLDKVAAKTKLEWHSQAAHKIAVCLFILDSAEIKAQADRDAILKQFMATPSSFGCNASALGQALGRPTSAAKVETIFGGM